MALMITEFVEYIPELELDHIWKETGNLSTLCTVAISHCKTCLLPHIYILTSALYRITQYRPTPILQTTVSISGKPDYDLSIPLTLEHICDSNLVGQ